MFENCCLDQLSWFRQLWIWNVRVASETEPNLHDQGWYKNPLSYLTITCLIDDVMVAIWYIMIPIPMILYFMIWYSILLYDMILYQIVSYKSVILSYDSVSYDRIQCFILRHCIKWYDTMLYLIILYRLTQYHMIHHI